MNIIKQLNIKADKRTAKNFALLPIMVFVRIPLVLLIFFGEYISENLYDYLPGWDSN